jgi:hypothetical protein
MVMLSRLFIPKDHHVPLLVSFYLVQYISSAFTVKLCSKQRLLEPSKDLDRPTCSRVFSTATRLLPSPSITLHLRLHSSGETGTTKTRPQLTNLRLRRLPMTFANENIRNKSKRYSGNARPCRQQNVYIRVQVLLLSRRHRWLIVVALKGTSSHYRFSVYSS